MKRGQAAMEFLMTYGWALLIVLVAIAVLAAMGVFQGKIGYEACVAGTGLSCKEFKAQRVSSPTEGPDAGRIEIQFLNGFGKDIYEFFVTIDPAMKACPGITGAVASKTLSPFYPSPFGAGPLPESLATDRTLPILRLALPLQPTEFGLSCDHVYSNCCSALNDVLGSLSANIRVPCTTPTGIACVGIGLPGSGQGRLPNPGSRVKLDFFITYRFGDQSALLHSRKGYLATTVESPP